MNDDTPKICCICGKPFIEYGNNPAPFEGELCCNDCDNRIVVPERIRLATGREIGPLPPFERVELLDDDFKCPCGNNSNGQGAYYSDLVGNELDGPASHDDPGYWCCDNCGRIFDSHTGLVVRERVAGYTYLATGH